MKILLDECVTKRLKARLPQYKVFTVMKMGWGGLKYGKLLKQCVDNGFDISLKIDKNLMFQQNLDKCELMIVVLNFLTSKIEELPK